MAARVTELSGQYFKGLLLQPAVIPSMYSWNPIGSTEFSRALEMFIRERLLLCDLTKG